MNYRGGGGPLMEIMHRRRKSNEQICTYRYIHRSGQLTSDKNMYDSSQTVGKRWEIQ